MSDRLFQIRRPTPSASDEAGPAGGAALDRRAFMQVTAGTLAIASSGCAAEVPTKIVPYTRPPEGVAPGLSTYYATSLTLEGYASGVLVESREGRPIKVEPNPDHPASLGGTSAFEQAAVRQLYDDARGRGVRAAGGPGSWEDLFDRLRSPIADRGAGLRLLLEPCASPLVSALLDRVLARFPEARIAFHSAVRQENEAAGAALAFGRALLPRYDFSRADAIVSLDADFLNEGPFAVRYARQWAGRRRLASSTAEPSRLYVVESQLSTTGTMADERLRRPLADVPACARALAAALDVGGGAGVDAEAAAWARTVAADLRRRPRGRTLVLAGDRQPAAIHALAYAINHALGNGDATVSFAPPVLRQTGGAVQAFDEQVGDMRAGRVQTLLVIDANPVYTAPADLRYGEALARVQTTVCLSYYEHETARRCRFYAPATHALETWGDGRAYDGTVSMVQPLIRRLADARTATELLAALAGAPAPDAYQLAREHWTRDQGLSELEWEQAVQRGFLPGTAQPTISPSLNAAAVERALAALPAPRASLAGRIDLELYPSPTVYDGRFANNPWLMELPTPVGKLTWDNAALMSPAMAHGLGVENGRVIELAAGHATVEAPVYVVSGMADGVIAAWLGYGRSGAESIAAGVGFNAYPLRTRAHLHTVPDGRVRDTGRNVELAPTQRHFSAHDRAIALRASLREYRADPDFTAPHRGPVPSLMPEDRFAGNQWAMTIDLGLCTGCSACVVSCQAENNWPVVGKAQIAKGREMAWLRIDTYLSGPPEALHVVHQPMMCQHCEKAPCEYVCPVGATVHSPDGLNEMVYNRCVGTRFCSNNCPYKVRRFNWFNWGDHEAMNRGLPELQYNPDVTVRERGVMEKCTYCVQRIRRAEITARVEDRPLRPGEVVTACQAACPTGAIQFGSLANRRSEMVRWRQQDRSYGVLQREEGTQPRTYYLARIDNPNEEHG
jgi:molybdopterin-containing oxidoreductase family iron-sulfur binding subunit